MKKQKPIKSEKAYIFDIDLKLDNLYTQMQNIEEKVTRTIAILGNQNLYDFAESIVDTFGFSFDHCFGFFDNLKVWYKSKVKYELFSDMPETKDEAPGAKSVKKTKIQQVFKNSGDKMLFLFDYGDNWEFTVKLKKIEESSPTKSYPLLLQGSGKAPEQYPTFEDEDE